MVVKKITFHADEILINKARQKAQKENTSLNHLFQKWLKRYIYSDKANFDYEELMNSLSYANA